MGVKHKQVNGFALPAVLITSIVMMILLLSGLVSVSGANVTIRSQMYDQLAQEAAEAGISMMVGCIQSGETLPTSATFTAASQNCSSPAPASSNPKSICMSNALNTASDSKYVTTFEVSSPVSSGDYYIVKAKGIVSLYRGSNTNTTCTSLIPSGAVKTYTKNLDLRIRYDNFVANTSSSGSLFVCGIVNQLSYCWGKNNEKQLGNGTIDPSSQPYEWGDGQDGFPQLDGTGKEIPILTEVKRTANNEACNLPGLCAKEIDIAAGDGFACAITTNDQTLNDVTEKSKRKVVCWGENSSGQMGDGSATRPLNGFYDPLDVTKSWANGSNPVQYPVKIKAASNYICVQTEYSEGGSSDNRSNLWCWGANGNGQLGNGETSNDPQRSPQQVLGVNTIKFNIVDFSLNVGGQHVCAIENNGNRYVDCWGFNEYGQTGTGTNGQADSANRRIPRPTRTLKSDGTPLSAKALAVGGFTMSDSSDPGFAAYSCAIERTNDKLFCWGRNWRGEVTTSPTRQMFQRANQIDSMGSYGTNYIATRIVGSAKSLCAAIRPTSNPIIDNERLWCWGSNRFGELGSGNITSSPGTLPTGEQGDYGVEPRRVAYFDTRRIANMDGGGYRFCAVSKDENYCWGRNHTGQTGNGRATEYQASPVLSTFISPAYPGISY